MYAVLIEKLWQYFSFLYLETVLEPQEQCLTTPREVPNVSLGTTALEIRLSLPGGVRRRAAASSQWKEQLRWLEHLFQRLLVPPWGRVPDSPLGRRPWGKLWTRWRDYLSLWPGNDLELSKKSWRKCVCGQGSLGISAQITASAKQPQINQKIDGCCGQSTSFHYLYKSTDVIKYYFNTKVNVAQSHFYLSESTCRICFRKYLCIQSRKFNNFKISLNHKFVISKKLNIMAKFITCMSYKWDKPSSLR